MLDAALPSDLVSQHIPDAGIDAGYQMVGEIEVILAGSHSDSELRTLIAHLGSRYDPGAEGGEVRPWLRSCVLPRWRSSGTAADMRWVVRGRSLVN